jgi:anti-sigma regulatory factor (Ser/Thr protein kinase)
MAVRTVEMELEPTANSVAEARARLEEGLRGAIKDRVLEDLRLLVSELVTNSVRHAHLRGRDRVDVRVEAEPDRVRAEVTDPGPGFERPLAAPEAGACSGWGLFLVGRIANRWGVDHDDGHTRVWFELDR